MAFIEWLVLDSILGWRSGRWELGGVLVFMMYVCHVNGFHLQRACNMLAFDFDFAFAQRKNDKYTPSARIQLSISHLTSVLKSKGEEKMFNRLNIITNS